MNKSEFEDAYDDALHIQGEILGTPIRRLSLRDPVSVDGNATVGDAVRAMNTHHTGCVLVIDGGRLAGIFTERDLITRVFGRSDAETIRVDSVMTRDPESLEPDDSIAYALNHMSVGGYRHIPIVEGGRPVGVLSVKNVVDFLVDLFPEGVINLPPTPGHTSPRTVDGG